MVGLYMSLKCSYELKSLMSANVIPNDTKQFGVILISYSTLSQCR